MLPFDTSAKKLKLESYAFRIFMVPGFTPPIVVPADISNVPSGFDDSDAPSSVLKVELEVMVISSTKISFNGLFTVPKLEVLNESTNISPKI